MNLTSGAAFTGVYLAETGFDVRSRRRNRPRAGPAKNKLLSRDRRLLNFVVPMTVKHGRDTYRLACVLHTPTRSLGQVRQLPDEPFHGLFYFVIRPRPTASWKPSCESRTRGQSQVSACLKVTLEELQAFSL